MQTYNTTYRDTAMAVILTAIRGTEIEREALAKSRENGLKPEDAMQNALTFLLVYAAVKNPEIMAVLTAK